MKKYVLTIVVVTTFAVYSFTLRHKDSSHIAIVAPATPSPQNSSPTNTPNNSTTTTPPLAANTTSYKDGAYKSNVEDAYYGNVQIQVIIKGGHITNVQFLQTPNTHQTSIEINQQATPYLKQEAIQAQNAQVNVITGATFTSNAFIKALTSVLSQAQ